jgi:hypothetical protein
MSKKIEGIMITPKKASTKSNETVVAATSEEENPFAEYNNKTIQSFLTILQTRLLTVLRLQIQG